MFFEDIDCDMHYGKDVWYDIDINMILKLEELVVTIGTGWCLLMRELDSSHLHV